MAAKGTEGKQELSYEGLADEMIAESNLIAKNQSGNQMLTEKDISIDHFVPWSYVAHDELRIW